MTIHICRPIRNCSTFGPIKSMRLIGDGLSVFSRAVTVTAAEPTKSFNCRKATDLWPASNVRTSSPSPYIHGSRSRGAVVVASCPCWIFVTLGKLSIFLVCRHNCQSFPVYQLLHTVNSVPGTGPSCERTCSIALCGHSARSIRFRRDRDRCCSVQIYTAVKAKMFVCAV